jgi:transposase-like protein
MAEKEPKEYYCPNCSEFDGFRFMGKTNLDYNVYECHSCHKVFIVEDITNRLRITVLEGTQKAGSLREAKE